MAIEQHVSGWFRDEFKESQSQGKTGDRLRIAMYEKGIAYLNAVIENDYEHWNAKKKDVKDVLKMIRFSQGWIR